MASYLELLKKIEMFQDLTIIEINLLSSICEEKEYSEWKLLVREKVSNEGLYVIQTGKVTVYKGEGGNQKILTELNSGQSFGEMSMVDDFPASATIITVEPSALLFMAKEDFNAFIKEHQEIGLKIYRKISQILAGRLRASNEAD